MKKPDRAYREQTPNHHAILRLYRYLAGFALLLAGIAILPHSVKAQEGMTFDELAPKLTDAFNSDMISDLRAKLPAPGSYKIWGYDAGDFSGDGYPDCAISIQIPGEGGKRLHVYFFVDDEGVMKNVGTETRTYLQLPIEVGVNINDGVCSVVAKKDDKRWEIISYYYRFGEFMVADSFARDFRNPIAVERTRDFLHMEGTDRFYNFDSDSNYLLSNYLILPCYRRGNLPYVNAQAVVSDTSSRFVVSGSYYWTGAQDCSFSTQTAYDDDFLYFLVRVTDDRVITYAKSPTGNDFVDIWLDAALTHRIATERPDSSMVFRTRADSNLFHFTIDLGNFLDKKPHIKLASSQQFNDDQYAAMRLMKSVSRKTDAGYLVKVRIPFSVLGLDGAPVENDIASLGCTVVVHDVDNGYRPEEATEIATSAFDPKNPTSYGELKLIPRDKRYGVEHNIYLDDIIERIGDVGF